MAKTDGGPIMPIEDSLAREMEQAALEGRAHAVDLVIAIHSLNKQIKPLEGLKDRAVSELKQWMALEGVDSLTDEERGLTATLTERHSAPTYDLVALVDYAPNAILEAARAGMLRVDGAMLDRFRKGNGATWADQINRAKMPGSISSVLNVTEDKR